MASIGEIDLIKPFVFVKMRDKIGDGRTIITGQAENVLARKTMGMIPEIVLIFKVRGTGHKSRKLAEKAHYWSVNIQGCHLDSAPEVAVYKLKMMTKDERKIASKAFGNGDETDIGARRSINPEKNHQDCRGPGKLKCSLCETGDDQHFQDQIQTRACGIGLGLERGPPLLGLSPSDLEELDDYVSRAVGGQYSVLRVRRFPFKRNHQVLLLSSVSQAWQRRNLWNKRRRSRRDLGSVDDMIAVVKLYQPYLRRLVDWARARGVGKAKVADRNNNTSEKEGAEGTNKLGQMTQVDLNSMKEWNDVIDGIDADSGVEYAGGVKINVRNNDGDNAGDVDRSDHVDNDYCNEHVENDGNNDYDDNVFDDENSSDVLMGRGSSPNNALNGGVTDGRRKKRQGRRQCVSDHRHIIKSVIEEIERSSI